MENLSEDAPGPLKVWVCTLHTTRYGVHLYVLGIGIFACSLLIELILIPLLLARQATLPAALPLEWWRWVDALAGPRLSRRYTGQATLPKQVYVGDAKDLSLILHLKSEIKGLLEERLDVQDTETGKEVGIQIRQPDKKEHFLEVELQAAGCTVAGDPKQRQSLQLETLAFHWNCHFPNSGNLRLSLILKSIHQAGERTLGSINQDVRVNKFDHATHRQVSLLAIVVGIPGFIGALFGAVLLVIQFIHIAGMR